MYLLVIHILFSSQVIFVYINIILASNYNKVCQYDMLENCLMNALSNDHIRVLKYLIFFFYVAHVGSNVHEKTDLSILI